MDKYREKYLILTQQYSRDICELHSTLKDLRNSICGMSKLCGHDFTCSCSCDKANEVIEKFNN